MAVMGKKIWCAFLGGGNNVLPANGTLVPVLLTDFIAEEDIVVVGAQLHVDPTAGHEIANDGDAYLHVHLTQYGLSAIGWRNELLYALGHQHWNTTPAGVSYLYAAPNIMFPEGAGISLKEGESFELWAHGNNLSAAEVQMGCSATLFYVKGTMAR
ncbi:hypothetical protein ES703_120209 [subsurface metagenome]